MVLRVAAALYTNRGKVVKGMSAALKSMKPEKISAILDKFEQQFEDLDVSALVARLTVGLVCGYLAPVWGQNTSFLACILWCGGPMLTFWREFGLGYERLHGRIDGQLFGPDNT